MSVFYEYEDAEEVVYNRVQTVQKPVCLVLSCDICGIKIMTDEVRRGFNKMREYARKTCDWSSTKIVRYMKPEGKKPYHIVVSVDLCPECISRLSTQ